MAKEDVMRIEPDEAQRRLSSGEAMLVCAYDSDEKFDDMHLAGAISLNEFKARLPEIPQEQQVIFYCA